MRRNGWKKSRELGLSTTKAGNMQNKPGETSKAYVSLLPGTDVLSADPIPPKTSFVAGLDAILAVVCRKSSAMSVLRPKRCEKEPVKRPHKYLPDWRVFRYVAGPLRTHMSPLRTHTNPLRMHMRTLRMYTARCECIYGRCEYICARCEYIYGLRIFAGLSFHSFHLCLEDLLFLLPFLKLEVSR